MHVQENASSLSGLLGRTFFATCGDRDSEKASVAMDYPNEIVHMILQEMHRRYASSKGSRGV